MRFKLLLGFGVAQNKIFIQDAPECEIIYTQEQIDFASQAGQDISHWKANPSLKTATKESKRVRRASHGQFVVDWPQAENFTGPGLRIPYRIQKNDFGGSFYTNIVKYLNEMSESLDGCIEFFDDTEAKLYPKNYFLIENGLSNGAYDESCKSHVGFINRTWYDLGIYQQINLGLLCHTRRVANFPTFEKLVFAKTSRILRILVRLIQSICNLESRLFFDLYFMFH